MAVTGKLQADFSSFYDAVAKAGESLQGLELSSQNVAKELSDMVASYRGDDLLRQTTLAVEAVNQLGGATSLTAKEQEALNAQVTEAIAKYEALGQEAPQALLDMQKATESADSSFGSFFTDTAAGFITSITSGQLLADAIGKIADAAKEAVMALPDLVEHSAELGNSIYEMSLKTGASVESLSQLRFVASQTGVDFDSFGNSMFKMEQALGKTGSAANKVKDDLGELGLNLDTLKNEKPDQAFIDIQSALEALPNRADQAKIGMDLFGKGFKDMAGLTQDSIKDLMAQADAMGVTMSTDTAAAAHAAEVGFGALQIQLEAVGSHISAALLPAIAGVEQALGVGLKAAIDAMGTSLQGTTGIIGTFVTAMGTGAQATQAQQQIFEDLRTGIIGLVQYGVEPLVTGFGWLMQQFAQAQMIGNTLALGIDELELAFVKLALYADKAAAAVSFGKAAASFNADAAQMQTAIGEVTAAIQRDKDAIDANKQSNDDWGNAAKTMNADIEAGVKAFGEAHVDVGKIVEDFAAKSTSAYGGVSTAVDATKDKLTGFAKTLADLTAKVDEANKHHVDLITQVRLFGQEAVKATDLALVYGKTVSDAVAAIAFAFDSAALDQKIKAGDDGLAKIGETIKTLTIPPTVQLQIELDKLAAKMDNVTKSGGDGITNLGFKVDAGFKEAAKAGQDYEKLTQTALKELETSFSEFGTLVGGTFGQISKTADTLIKDLSNVSKSFDTMKQGFSMGNSLAGIASAASGILGIAGAAITAGTAVAGLVSKVFGLGSAGRDAVVSFADSFGGFDALHTKLDALGDSGEQLWIKLTQGVGRNDAAGAQAAINAVTDALNAQTSASQDTQVQTEAQAAATIETATQASQALDTVSEKLKSSADDWATWGSAVNGVIDSVAKAVLAMPIPSAPSAGTVPGFATGTGGKFLDFGAGTLAMLHGPEKIVTPGEAGMDVGGDITINLNADGQRLAQVVVPNLPSAIKSYGLG